MAIIPRGYVDQPYVPNMGSLAQMLRQGGDLSAQRALLAGQSSAATWAGIANAFNQYQQTVRAKETIKTAAAIKQQEHAEEQWLKRQELQEKRDDRAEQNRIRLETEGRQKREEALKRAQGIASQVGYGPLVEDQVDPLMAEPETMSRVRYAFGPGTAEGPELMPNATQQRQITLDTQARTAAERANADRLADNARQQLQFDETKRHNQVTEAKEPRALAREVVQGPNGPLLVDKESGKTAPIIGPDGQPLKTAQSAAERMDSRKFSKAAPVLKGIGELSERINTLNGVLASASGLAEKQKAKVNLNDDVAEYESLVSMFTPTVARALGHTGMLTEQDVQSVKIGFPRPEDSKSLRDRKMKRLLTIIDELESVEGVDMQPTPAPNSSQKPRRARNPFEPQ